MAIYIARHGETGWNRENRVLGRTDVPLNEKGFAQAAELAERLADTPIDIIYTSPLQRTVDTAKAVADRQKGARPCVVAEPCLIEHNFGIFEGVDRADPIYQREKRTFVKRYPGGESYLDVAARVYPFLEKLLEESRGKNILLVTHGGICRIITSYFQDMENEDFAAFGMKNCEVRKFG